VLENTFFDVTLSRYDYYEKPVTFKPFQVDLLDPVTANFLGDNLRCWMQIQVNKFPTKKVLSETKVMFFFVQGWKGSVCQRGVRNHQNWPNNDNSFRS